MTREANFEPILNHKRPELAHFTRVVVFIGNVLSVSRYRWEFEVFWGQCRCGYLLQISFVFSFMAWIGIIALGLV